MRVNKLLLINKDWYTIDVDAATPEMVLFY